MAPRTREQNEFDRLKRENDELKSQLALLGGLIVGSIHGKTFEGLDAMIDHIPYLQTLPSFVAMRGKRQPQTLDDVGRQGGE